MEAKSEQASDAALLQRYVDRGDERAFEELVQRHLTMVFSAALRKVGNPAAAEDISQMVFIQLAKSAPKLVRHPVLAGWLYTTASRLGAESCRREARRQKREELMEQSEEVQNSELNWNQVKPVLDDAMQELSEEDRNGIILRYFEGRDFQSVGAALGLGTDAARMRVARGVERLRGVLKRYGITSTVLGLETMLAQRSVEAVPAGLLLSVAQALRGLQPIAQPWLALSWPKLAATGAVVLALGGATHSFWKARRSVPQQASSTSAPSDAGSALPPGEKTVRMLQGRPLLTSAAGQMDPRLAEALGYLRSAIFDVALDKSERFRLLQESAGMLVGQEGATIPLFREALASPDPEVALMAVEALGRFGELPREFTAELLRLLEEPSFRDSAGLIANRLVHGLVATQTHLPTLLAMLERRPDLEEPITYLLTAMIPANPDHILLHRASIEKLLESSRPEISSAARRILEQLPEPPPAPDAERSAKIVADLRSPDDKEKRRAVQAIARLRNVTPEIREELSNLAQREASPALRVQARVELARFGMEPIPPHADAASLQHSGELAVPELLDAIADGVGNIPGHLRQIGAVQPSYWREHLPLRNTAAEMLGALQRHKDPRIYEAAADASARLHGHARPFYTIEELTPFFAAMESALSAGEYAIAMRDLRSSLANLWKARGFLASDPTHIPADLVQILFVGPSHENRPAYDQMLNAMKREVDPAFRAP